MRPEICSFGGQKIYPGHGSRFVRGDGKTFIFLSSKTSECFHHRWNPRKIGWTSVYRRAHKKEAIDTQKRRTKRRQTKYVRGIINDTADAISRRRKAAPVMTEAKAAAMKELRQRKKDKRSQKMETVQVQRQTDRSR